MVRIDNDFNLIWANTYNDSNYNDIFSGGFNFDKNYNIAITLSGDDGQRDGGILKLNSNGNLYLKKWHHTDLINEGYGDIILSKGKYYVSGGASSFISDSLTSLFCILDTNGNLLLKKYYYDAPSHYHFFTNERVDGFGIGGHNFGPLFYDIKMGVRFIDYVGNIIWTRVIENALSVSAPNNMILTSDKGYLLTGNYENIPADSYCIYIIKTDSNAYAEPLGISDEEFMIPEEFVLYQNYPNPFNPDTKIKYEINKKAHYKMRLYDVNGRLISVIIDETVSPGTYEKNLNIYFKDLSSSVYFISLENDKQVLTRKLLFLK